MELNVKNTGVEEEGGEGAVPRKNGDIVPANPQEPGWIPVYDFSRLMRTTLLEDAFFQRIREDDPRLPIAVRNHARRVRRGLAANYARFSSAVQRKRKKK